MAIFDINKLREVEWDQGYLWEIMFKETSNTGHKSKLVAPFDEWFPAATVNDERFSIAEHPIDVHQFGSIPFPNSSVQRSITVGFYDDMNNTLLKWFSTWVNEDILNKGLYLTPLSQCTKEIYITKLNSQRQPIGSPISYLVIPSGNLDYQGTEHSDSTIHSVRLLIVGEN